MSHHKILTTVNFNRVYWENVHMLLQYTNMTSSLKHNLYLVYKV